MGITEILQALIALPQILEFASELVRFLKGTFGDDWQKFLSDSSHAFKELNDAKTPQEKREVARKLQNLIGRIG